jgi:alkaline phosphatase D
MNGYSEMREAMVWVQMKQACEVQLVYWPDSLPANKMKSAVVKTNQETAFVAHLTANEVGPGTRYGYEILANGKVQTAARNLTFKTQELWQFRKDPADFTIATGSCAYINEPPYDRPGKKYGSDYKIFEKIADANPDMMLWLGDNIYLREVDWFTRTGILKRYTHMRAVPELQRLLASTHHYAIWDDHDFGPNDANRAFPHKDKTLEAFKLFWANNSYGVNELGGISSAFQFNDIDFFLLDNRWNRSHPELVSAPTQMLGKEQIDWLIELLKYSQAPFKLIAVGGQILNNAKVYENYSNYEAERELLLDRIAAEGITGVVFLTGDRHHAELIKVNHKGTVMYDLTTSPLTSGTHKSGDADTANRVEGTLYLEHNFALLEVSGTRKERVLKLRLMNKEGQEVWNHILRAADWNNQ